jgi:uncharacterized phage protein (TIGR02220 family)
MNEVIIKTIEYLNLKTNSKIEGNDPKAVKLIGGLITIGHNYDDFVSVIDKKMHDWKGTKYQEYVRPQTLFGNNFNRYLNESRNSKSRFERISDSVERAKSTYWRLD